MKFEWLTRWFRITIEFFSFGERIRRYEVTPRRRSQPVRRELYKRTQARMGIEPLEGTT